MSDLTTFCHVCQQFTPREHKCTGSLTEDSISSDKYLGTPEYYKRSEQDLYDIFIAQYGLDAWLRHVEMECIQYISRARLKGNYAKDISKVAVIVARILREVDKCPTTDFLETKRGYTNDAA